MRGSEFSADVAQQIGRRARCLAGLDTALNSGMWIAVADQESVVSVPCASSEDVVEFTRPDGVSATGQRIMTNAATLRKVSRLLFEECSEEPGTADTLVVDAIRYAQQY